jgi:hypothetical protein
MDACPFPYQDLYTRSFKLHIVALVVAAAMCLMYLSCIVWPAISRNVRERKRVAELLCSLPPELKVERLVRQALAFAPSAAAAAAAGAPAGGLEPGVGAGAGAPEGGLPSAPGKGPLLYGKELLQSV